MGEALEIQSSAAHMGEHACKMLTQDEITQFWPAISLELRNIQHVWDQWWTEDAIRVQVEMGNMQVWVAGKPPEFNLVIFTQILYYPASTIFQVVIMFGNEVEEVLPVVVATLEHYAEQSGCRYAEVFGRSGWERKLEKYGFRRSATVLSKPLGVLRRH